MSSLALVEAPPITPLPYGLLSTAVVLDQPASREGPRWQMGVQYEADACNAAYDREGYCQTPDGLGTLVAASPNELEAVLALTGTPPAGTYTVDWGDDSDDDFTQATLDGADHTYAAPDTYTITVTGPDGYHAVATVVIDDVDPLVEVDFTVTRTYIPTDGVLLVTGDPFLVYTDLTCRAVGDWDRMTERARAALRNRSGYAVERVMAAQMQAALAADPVVLNPTPGTPVHPVDGLAFLEDYAAANYGGVPVIHHRRSLGTVLTTHGSEVRGSGRLETVQGSLVASGAGYGGLQGDEGTDAAAGTAWMYVTGTVVVRRDAVPEVIGPLRTPGTNDTTAQARAVHVITWECVTAAVLVETPYTVNT